MRSKRLIAVHLLNDWSGSPLVFRQALETLQQARYVITLFTATPPGGGFLTGITGVTTRDIQYNWHPAKLITLVNYLRVQLSLFLRLLVFLRSTDTVYINTLLPFGAALAGWLRGCEVVYHVHEVSIKPRLLKMWLLAVANRTARQVIFVSGYTARQTAMSRPARRLIYNALPDSFTKRANLISAPNTVFPFTALMLCSNKGYKGICEFVEAARQLPHIRFWLVLNATADDVAAFVKQADPSGNCTIFPAQTDTVPFYEQAHVVLNLSHSNAWVETFGLTILEGMTCGRPVIVPPVGGVRELIDDGVEGFVVDALQPHALVNALRLISSDMALYRHMAAAARHRAEAFSSQAFRRSINLAFATDDEPANLTSPPLASPLLQP